jgi:hypothetical protein
MSIQGSVVKDSGTGRLRREGPGRPFLKISALDVPLKRPPAGLEVDEVGNLLEFGNLLKASICGQCM